MWLEHGWMNNYDQNEWWSKSYGFCGDSFYIISHHTRVAPSLPHPVFLKLVMVPWDQLSHMSFSWNNEHHALLTKTHFNFRTKFPENQTNNFNLFDLVIWVRAFQTYRNQQISIIIKLQFRAPKSYSIYSHRIYGQERHHLEGQSPEIILARYP